MKKIIKIITYVLILTFELFAQQKVIFEANLQKDTFLLGEPVDFGIRIVNTSNTKSLNGILQYRILNENNSVVSNGARAIGDVSHRTIVIKSNEDVCSVGNLIELYGQPYKLAPIYMFIPIGNYTLEVNFLSSDTPKLEKKLNFQIINPIGEDSIVYHTFMDIVTKNHTSFEEVQTVESLYQKYPNSVYSPFLLMDLDACYDIQIADPQKALSIRKELVKKYPGSSIAGTMLEGILKQMLSKTERIEYLKKLQADSKNTLMEKMYEKILKEESVK